MSSCPELTQIHFYYVQSLAYVFVRQWGVCFRQRHANTHYSLFHTKSNALIYCCSPAGSLFFSKATPELITVSNARQNQLLVDRGLFISSIPKTAKKKRKETLEYQPVLLLFRCGADNNDFPFDWIPCNTSQPIENSGMHWSRRRPLVCNGNQTVWTNISFLQADTTLPRTFAYA